MTQSDNSALALIATYNERENILALTEKIFSLPCNLSVMIVDDASPDGTAGALRERFGSDQRMILVEREGKQGYGTAMVEGFKQALQTGAKSIITLDADFSHDPADIPLLIEALKESTLAIGSRYHSGVRVLNWPPRRLVLSLFANSYVRRLLALPYFDNTSGFRAYRREVLECIDLESLSFRGYAFLVEILYRAHLQGFSVQEVPIIFTERREGQSKMSGGIILESALAPWRMRFRKNRMMKQFSRKVQRS